MSNGGPLISTLHYLHWRWKASQELALLNLPGSLRGCGFSVNLAQGKQSEYYGKITINNDALDQLPDDAVPYKILLIVQQLDDIALLDQEGAGCTCTDDIGTVSEHLLHYWLMTSFTSGSVR